MGKISDRVWALPGQCRDRKLLWPAQERVALSIRVWIHGALQTRTHRNISTITITPVSRWNLKGLTPALHRQQALLTAWTTWVGDICLTFWGHFSSPGCFFRLDAIVMLYLTFFLSLDFFTLSKVQPDRHTSATAPAANGTLSPVAGLLLFPVPACWSS